MVGERVLRIGTVILILEKLVNNLPFSHICLRYFTIFLARLGLIGFADKVKQLYYEMRISDSICCSFLHLLGVEQKLEQCLLVPLKG